MFKFKIYYFSIYGRDSKFEVIAESKEEALKKFHEKFGDLQIMAIRKFDI